MGCHSSKPTGDEDNVTFHEKYQITQKLGTGSDAQVYEAERVTDGTRWAVKIADLRRYSKSAAPDEIDFEKERKAGKEALLLRKFRNESHVVNLVEAFQDCLFSYIVLELCDMTLVEGLDGMQVLNANILGGILDKMRLSLVAIHKAGIIHGDIKPDNFLLGTRNLSTVKLCDFGSSEPMPLVGGRKGIRGLAPFTSPEMLNSASYGTKTDVWSLGVIAYVLLYGQYPYQPSEHTDQSMKTAIMAGSPAPDFRAKKGLVRGDGRICEHSEQSTRALLARDPKSRPSAEAAGRLPWFARRADGAEPQSHQCLKPMLYSAKHLGGFDARSTHTKRQGALDITLARLQADVHGSVRRDSRDSPIVRPLGSGGSSQNSPGTLSAARTPGTPSALRTPSSRPSKAYVATLIRKI